ncbi:MAG: hypothetical protein II155_00095 [Clostridia bacterium]|jgi:division/cell wall cluster transcriptional repressor MraZ|nr:hypothetical protein [Clostridia bacterium]
MIVGSFNVTVDAQGRLIVPSDWAEALGERVVVIRDLSPSGEHFLTALPMEAYQSYISDFAHNPASDPRSHDLSRKLLQYACDCKIDQKKRRISIVSSSLQYAGIETSAVLTANIRSSYSVFEIWAPEALERSNAEFDEWQYQEALKKNADEVKGIK